MLDKLDLRLRQYLPWLSDWVDMGLMLYCVWQGWS